MGQPNLGPEIVAEVGSGGEEVGECGSKQDHIVRIGGVDNLNAV